MPSLLPRLDADGWRPHHLHAPTRSWPETNCHVDLWIEVLHALGHEPEAVLPFTVAQDYEGDQFSLFKPPLDDIEAVYGLVVQELAIYDSLEVHVAEHVRRGRLLLVEVDGYYLPDIRGTAHRRDHVKTTIGIVTIDIAERSSSYFHNAGFFKLTGDDYDGIFRRTPALRQLPGLLFPHVEMVRRARPALHGQERVRTSLGLLRRHLQRRPRFNPITAYHDDLPRHLELLGVRSMTYFHHYTFNVLRQLGANVELLGSFLVWLGAHGEPSLEPAQAACAQMAADAKALQFQLARAVSRKRFDAYSSVLSRMEASYDTAMGLLAARYA